jgi:hypothetical protein
MSNFKKLYVKLQNSVSYGWSNDTPQEDEIITMISDRPEVHVTTK